MATLPKRKATETSLTLSFSQYQVSSSTFPLFLHGDALSVLAHLPDSSVDCCMTSPPYWNKREYDVQGIGAEATFLEYIEVVAAVCQEIKRVLKPTGSFWLNIGDSFDEKKLSGIPWRIALKLVDEQGWILREDIVWNKVKGGLDNTKDKFRGMHEFIFHFVKDAKGYYFDIDAIRSKPREAKVVNGKVISATGVSGVRYRRQIELSTALSVAEKAQAMLDLQAALTKVAQGEVSDFRMIIRKQQRVTHSDSEKLSGRAKELRDKGYYFLFYHPNGSKPGDVWDILPEDTHKRENHFAAYPEDLCKLPLLATCPVNGLALDPFCGTGTTTFVAFLLHRKSIGIDISAKYLASAERRAMALLNQTERRALFP